MTLAEQIDRTRIRIDAALTNSGRTDPVTLELAVKMRTPEICREAARCLSDLGLPVVLGHNRVQEAHATAEAIREVPGASIHLIGPLQSNKVNQALAFCDLIETVDSRDLVERLDRRCARGLPVLVQVNTSGEASKRGCRPEDVDSLIECVELAGNLRLEGFMTVGLHSDVEAEVRDSYARLREIRDRTAEQLVISESDLALSMGMSADLEWAIAEGATTVRVGTAVFGPRPASAPRHV